MAEILADVAAYYTGKLAEFGATARGVDWNGAPSQEARFAQLARVLEGSLGCSVNDLGCGYGALRDFLSSRGCDVDYAGYDISEAMVAAARARLPAGARATFEVAAAPARTADFGVASGIFNVRLAHAIPDWEQAMAQTLDALNATSRRGYAFNCLSLCSDPDRRRPDLYYGDACRWFGFCQSRHARNVALLHDYGLYEFTIIVRKDA